jgi:hypothetical protein
MSSLFETLTKSLGGDAVGHIAKQLGTDENTTGGAMAAVLPTLLGALTRNAKSAEGAESLSRALDRDHDGSILDNLSGFLGNPESGNGAGILRHALGGRQQQVERGLSRTTGLDAGTIGKLLVTLAPVVMGALGKQKREQQMDASALSGFLGREEEDARSKAPQELGFIGQLLDADGDGDVDGGDIAKQGLGMLGKLFSK